MDWRFTPYAVPLFVGAFFLIGIAVLVWRKRTLRGAWYFFLLCLSLNFYVIGYALELGSQQPQVVHFWLKVEYLGIPIDPVLLLLMTLAYTGRRRFLTPMVHLTLLIIPTITVVLAWTNEFHGLLWSDIHLDLSHGYTATLFTRGAWNWVQTVYTYFCSIASLVLFVQAFRKAQGLYRRQLAVILIGIVTVLAISVAYLGGLTPPGLDATPYSYCIAAVLAALGMFQYQIFDLMPIAHEQVLASISDAIVAVDEQLRVVEVNPAAEAIINRPREAIIGSDLAVALSPEIAALAAADGSQEVLLTVPGKDHASEVPFEVSSQPISGMGARAIGRLLVLRDISERKQAKQQEVALLLEQERTGLITDFIRDVSHESKTPLAVIQTATFLLKKLVGDNPQSAAQIEQIERQVGYLNSLIETMLTMSRLDAAAGLDAVPLAVNDLVLSLRDTFLPACQEKDLVLELKLADTLPPVCGDAKELQRAISHLIENTITYTPSGGTIAVQTAALPGVVSLVVRDSGVGISPEHLPHIFNRFYRVDKARSTRHAGLGLSIAQKIIALHGGRIEVESVLGAGSTFRMLLPQKQPEEVCIRKRRQPADA